MRPQSPELVELSIANSACKSADASRTQLEGEKPHSAPLRPQYPQRLSAVALIRMLDHPVANKRSPDGQWLLYGSRRDGVRQLFLLRLADYREFPLTHLTAGNAALWPYWQPATCVDCRQP